MQLLFNEETKEVTCAEATLPGLTKELWVGLLTQVYSNTSACPICRRTILVYMPEEFEVSPAMRAHFKLRGNINGKSIMCHRCGYSVYRILFGGKRLYFMSGSDFDISLHVMLKTYLGMS